VNSEPHAYGGVYQELGWRATVALLFLLPNTTTAAATAAAAAAAAVAAAAAATAAATTVVTVWPCSLLPFFTAFH
jgi:hypothetical protein